MPSRYSFFPEGGTWTYSGDPSTSPRDETRFWLQDTDGDMPLLADVEIDFLLVSTSSVPLLAASIGAEVLGAKFAREVDVSADGVSVGVSALQQRYNDLAQSLRDQWRVLGDVSNGLGSDADSSYLYDLMAGHIPGMPPLLFGIGFMDNPEAGQQDYGWRTSRNTPIYVQPGE